MTKVEESLRRQRAVWAKVAASAAAKPKAAPWKRLLLFGLGSSSHCAHLTEETILRAEGAGRREIIACSPLDVGRAVAPREGDLAVAFSHRGKSQLTLYALETCRKGGAASALACAEGCAPEDAAQTVLASGPLEECEPHTTGMTGAICAATSWLLPEAAPAWQKLSRSHDPSLPGCRSSVGEGPEIVLGHGAGEWVAREAALKFVEMSRTCVEAFETEEFFHGWSFARQERRIWHVVEEDDPRQGKAASARRFPIATGEPFAWVEPLVELQWLALALALNMARNPDDPRPVAA